MEVGASAQPATRLHGDEHGFNVRGMRLLGKGACDKGRGGSKRLCREHGHLDDVRSILECRWSWPAPRLHRQLFDQFYASAIAASLRTVDRSVLNSPLTKNDGRPNAILSVTRASRAESLELQEAMLESYRRAGCSRCVYLAAAPVAPIPLCRQL